MPGRRAGFAHRLAIAGFLVCLSLVPTARASDAPPATTLPPIQVQEVQGLGCMSLGTVAGVGVWGMVYGDVITDALVTGHPLVLVPFMATAFVVGCNVGSTMAPGVLWLFNHIN